jgi:hypothetical protein
MTTQDDSCERPMSEGDSAHVAAARWTPAHARLLQARIAAGRIPADPPRGRLPGPRRAD